MHCSRGLLTVTVVLAGLFSSTFCRAQDQSSSADPKAAAIVGVVTGFINDFNRHDPRAMSNWFTEDGEFTNVNANSTRGRKEIEEHFIPLFKGRLIHARRAFTVRSVRFLTPAMASIEMDYELSGNLAPDGSTSAPSHGFYDWTIMKKNGRWLIAILHECIIAPEPGSAAPPR